MGVGPHAIAHALGRHREFLLRSDPRGDAVAFDTGTDKFRDHGAALTDAVVGARGQSDGTFAQGGIHKLRTGQAGAVEDKGFVRGRMGLRVFDPVNQKAAIARRPLVKI